MSDDKYLGVVCGCIPRRLFALLLALLLCSYGTAQILWAILVKHLPGEAGLAAWQSEDRCIGHRCADVLTCRGAREATMHFREVIWMLGCTAFGYWGALGALNRHVQHVRWFGGFLLGQAGLLLVLTLADGLYTVLCGAYPLNVVDEALLWSIPHLPVRQAVKKEIHDALASYPVGLINGLAHFQVFTFYLMVEAVRVLCFAFAGTQMLQLAHGIMYGTGLGANYDIRDWRERQIRKQNIAAMLRPNYQAIADA